MRIAMSLAVVGLLWTAAYAASDTPALRRGNAQTPEVAKQELEQFRASYSDLAGWEQRKQRIREGILKGGIPIKIIVLGHHQHPAATVDKSLNRLQRARRIALVKGRAKDQHLTWPAPRRQKLLQRLLIHRHGCPMRLEQGSKLGHPAKIRVERRVELFQALIENHIKVARRRCMGCLGPIRATTARERSSVIVFATAGHAERHGAQKTTKRTQVPQRW